MLARDLKDPFTIITKKIPLKELTPTFSTPTLLECAALSLDVYYQENDPKRPPLPTGWVRFMDSGKDLNGYYGVCYVKNPTKPSHVVFAHRGTTFDEMSAISGSIISDIEIGLNIFFQPAPFQLKSACNFVKKCIDVFHTKCSDAEFRRIYNYCLSTVGHSLGGVLADLIADKHIPAITFENPGSRDLFMQLAREWGKTSQEILSLLGEKYENCKTYQADVNLINTCNAQIGKCFSILPKTYNYFYGDRQPPALEELTSSVYTNIRYYLLSYTLHQHQMQSIYDQFKIGASTASKKYPHGFQAGYKAYLNYASRKDYWDGYIKTYWDENFDSTQTDYEGNFDEFKSDFIKQLNAAYDKALTSKQTIDKNLTARSSLQGEQFRFYSQKNPHSSLCEDDFVMIEKDTLSEDDFVLIEDSQKAVAIPKMNI